VAQALTTLPPTSTTGSGGKGRHPYLCSPKQLHQHPPPTTRSFCINSRSPIQSEPQPASSALRPTLPPEAPPTNTASTFRDLFISGPDIGITLTDFINFSIDRLTIAAWTNNVVLSSVNYPSFGDSHIQNSWFYGRNLTSNILVNASAGIAITNNKIVSGTVGINVNTTLFGNQNRPLIIANNSLEGQTTAIQFAELLAQPRSLTVLHQQQSNLVGNTVQ